MQASALQNVWFILIGVFWIGYFFLEGFDFGIGILLPFLARDDVGRRVLINTIGPVWDGNEVWLVVAGGATFAAFPIWYATLFSGFYLALLVILLALIGRAVAFEFRSHERHREWRQWWDRALFFGSLLPALLWGVAFSDMLRGVPISASGQYTGTLLDLLHPYALLGGVTFVLLFTLHGALFLGLKTRDELHERSRRAARVLWVPTVLAVFAYLLWSYLNALAAHNKGVVPDAVPLVGLAAVLVVGWLVRERLAGWAFVATGAAIVLIVATIFLNLYPRVLVSSTNPDYSLTIVNASSQPYTLGVMTIVAAIFTPLVLLYQGWTYWVFRRRLGRSDVAGGY
jgi:cytochrome bd ubiquinol oxidase subunit II